MGKFNLTGQVAVLDNADALKAQASGAVTDAGYLGGTSWIKSQLDAEKQLLKGNPEEIPGYEFVNFADANEGLVIPDGAFDFFDLTYDLTQKDVKECLVQFGLNATTSLEGTRFIASSAIDFTNNTTSGVNISQNAPAFLNFKSSGSDNPVYIVTTDYTECGFAGSVQPAASVSTAGQLGYKISGQNPPTDDSGDIYEVLSGTFSGEYHFFGQYKDATDSLTGMRYMVGLYNNVNALTDAGNDRFVVKSMSINVTPAGLNQLVIHCRKAQATTSHTINADGRVQGIHILKINY
jgi:hypothetical protein